MQNKRVHQLPHNRVAAELHIQHFITIFSSLARRIFSPHLTTIYRRFPFRIVDAKMAEPTPNSTANQKKPNTPLLGDANVGDRHEAEVLTETAELVNEDGGRGMAQQGGEVRDDGSL